MKLLSSSPWILLSLFLISASLLVVLFSPSFLHADDSPQSLEFALLKRPGDPPVFAYWISGSGGDRRRLIRLLKAVYHPRNRYLLHLDAGCKAYERYFLALAVRAEGIFRAFGNVDVVGKAYAVDRRGVSGVAAVLHGAAVLLRISTDWDWFIALGAEDYPLVSQDDLLHVFTPLPRDLNFIQHTSKLKLEEHDSFGKIVVDPSLHLKDNTHIFYSSETRTAPDAFKIFRGSPWMILSKPFMEHTVLGWDNLPRKLLLYLSNVANPMEAYFQTVICNSSPFLNTTINSDLRYHPELDSTFLNATHFDEMVDSGAAFARGFKENDLVLEKLDRNILRRSSYGVGVGRWCLGLLDLEAGDPCSSWGDINVVEPGPSGKKLRSLVAELVSDERLHSNRCK